MHRLYTEASLWLASLRARLPAEAGVTVPEYSLVLGVISVAVVVSFSVAGVSTAITAVSQDLASYITP
jgi:Flp pilus assembly pilin Flp